MWSFILSLRGAVLLTPSQRLFVSLALAPPNLPDGSAYLNKPNPSSSPLPSLSGSNPKKSGDEAHG